VFIRLRGANLKLTPTNVKLFQREIQFLSHRISGEGVAMDPDKISEIVWWHRPKTVHEVRQFLGLCGYYRRYVPNYSQVATPLHEMNKLAESFIWTEERDAVYETLKTHLVRLPYSPCIRTWERTRWTSTSVTVRQEPPNIPWQKIHNPHGPCGSIIYHDGEGPYRATGPVGRSYE